MRYLIVDENRIPIDCGYRHRRQAEMVLRKRRDESLEIIADRAEFRRARAVAQETPNMFQQIRQYMAKYFGR